jgi:coatomer subunit alpha
MVVQPALFSAQQLLLFSDIQQQKTTAEINSPPVKYVTLGGDVALVALMSKRSKQMTHGHTISF